jgi:hypothetical protein
MNRGLSPMASGMATGMALPMPSPHLRLLSRAEQSRVKSFLAMDEHRGLSICRSRRRQIAENATRTSCNQPGRCGLSNACLVADEAVIHRK